MKSSSLTILLIGLMVFLAESGCLFPEKKFPGNELPFQKTVEIRQVGKNYQLYRHGKPYYIRGAGGDEYFGELAANGGNSVRTWSTYQLKEILDRADSNGLTVLAGLDLWPERLGMNYNDAQMVADQKERIRKDVLTYKDHPALLMWGIGNELDLGYANEDVWVAVNDIAAMIHEIDPNHPTTTMIMPNARNTRLIAEKAPEIDILSFNVFGAAGKLNENLRKPWWGWKGPYIISEWGGLGWWERQTTQWHVPIDMPGTLKAQKLVEVYSASMKEDTSWCLGSYLFFWGNKQERTHTWFSFFTEEGNPTPMVEAARYNWTGKWPDNRAPVIDSVKLNNRIDSENIYLYQKQQYSARVLASDPEGQKLTYKWEIRAEGLYIKITGGDKEERPQPLPGLIQSVNDGVMSFTAPEQPGPYRIFVYISDPGKTTTIADIPFFVTHSEID
ncbi:MAG: glycoside hydrolase family 2 TIM barrel-domain containing protein [Bacteroidia bacterium]|nr:glycoside hydrolase family 2 TIM barrel-domain containing protein [Bacteroidia bacterium]